MTAFHFAGICAMALGAGLLGWLLRRQDVSLRVRRWRTWRAHLQAARRQGATTSASSLRILHAAMPRRGAMPGGRAPHSACHEPLPRFLFLGDASAALPALLAAIEPAGPSSVDLPLEDEPFWRWWRLPRLVAIELCPPPLPPEVPLDLLWLHGLRALTQTQPERPLAGLVLCASAALLRSDPEVAQPLMQLLARRIHETPAVLHQSLPVYLLLTGLQDLPGYATVRAALPEPLAGQALGWQAAPGQAESAWPEAAATWQTSLHGMRLALLAHERTALERHDIHRFVEAALALMPGLQRLQQTLNLEADPRLHWQGFYLTAAAPQSAFVHDLFDRFLPASAVLARNDG